MRFTLTTTQTNSFFRKKVLRGCQERMAKMVIKVFLEKEEKEVSRKLFSNS